MKHRDRSSIPLVMAGHTSNTFADEQSIINKLTLKDKKIISFIYTCGSIYTFDIEKQFNFRNSPDRIRKIKTKLGNDDFFLTEYLPRKKRAGKYSINPCNEDLAIKIINSI